MGISWGGFNSLQVAALRPPALKAIVTICSTDDRYRDDVHYMGGTLLRAGIDWGAFFFRTLCQPPDPALVGEHWRRMWLERLNNIPARSDPDLVEIGILGERPEAFFGELFPSVTKRIDDRVISIQQSVTEMALA